MNRKVFFGRSIKDIFFAFGPSLALLVIGGIVAFKFVNPAPPDKFVIAAGEEDGDYYAYAKLYKEFLKDEDVKVDIRSSMGASENLALLQDEKSDIEVGFVQDGLGNPDKAPDLESLGSLYYEPIWLFYRASSPEMNRYTQLIGKTISLGKEGSGTKTLALKLLQASGVNESNTKFVSISSSSATEALRKGEIDAAIFMATAEDKRVREMILDSSFKLMSVDQAEGITRQFPYLHHLVLPHGSIDLKRNIPGHDIDLVGPTATLVVKDSLHPALIYLLLRAATQVHGTPGILEKKGEFPIDKDYQFPLSDEAKAFYKTGSPFWQRLLPFWLATLAERFFVFVIPVIALLLPMIRLVPRIYRWRIRSRIYQRYGELKFLEAKIQPAASHIEFLDFLTKLDDIENRVNHLKVPLEFADHVYVLRQHIDFVRQRLRRIIHNQPSDLSASSKF